MTVAAARAMLRTEHEAELTAMVRRHLEALDLLATATPVTSPGDR